MSATSTNGNDVFFGNWTDAEGMKGDFEISDKELEGAEILFAGYGYGGYEGEAIVLFERAGKLYEVNACHCSCYGVEGQWSPEETTPEAIRQRKPDLYGDFGSDIQEAINRYEAKHGN